MKPAVKKQNNDPLGGLGWGGWVPLDSAAVRAVAKEKRQNGISNKTPR